MKTTNQTIKTPVWPYLLLTLTMLLWAGNFVVGRALRTSLPPIALTFWRWTIASVVLLPLAWTELRASKTQIFRDWRWLLCLSVTGVAAYNSLLYKGLQTTTAINASLMLSLAPVLIAFGCLFLGHKGGLQQWAGIFTSLTGAFIIVFRGDITNVGQLTVSRGDAWVIAAVLVWVIYTLLLSRRPSDLSPVLVQFLISTVGVLILAPAYLLEISTGSSMVLHIKTFLALGYVGIFASVLAYVLWNRAVGQVGPTPAGLFLHLIPVFSTIMSFVFLGEAVHAYQICAAILISIGIAITTRAKLKSKKECRVPDARREAGIEPPGSTATAITNG